MTIKPKDHLDLVELALTRLRVTKNRRADAYQEGALALCEAAATWTGEEPARRWIYTRIRWAILKFLGEEQRHDGEAYDDEAEHATVELTSVPEIMSEVAALPTRLRKVVEAKIAGYTDADAAAQLGISPRGFKRWLKEAREKLAQKVH